MPSSLFSRDSADHADRCRGPGRHAQGRPRQPAALAAAGGDTRAPESNTSTPDRVALGEKLFFDPRLSVSGQTSCASCHAPERGWADGLPLSMRLMGERMTRNSPTVVNVAFNPLHGWDGKSTSLEQQALNSQSMTGSLQAGSKGAGPHRRRPRHRAHPQARMKGAFRTPTLREVGQSAPYFHDGSAARLQDVVDHYIRGGDVHTNLSASLKPLTLTAQERADLLAFLQALDTPYVPYDAPRLPR